MIWPETDPGQWTTDGPTPGEKGVTPILVKARTVYDRSAYVRTNRIGVVYETPDISTAIVTAGLWICTATIVDFTSPERRGTALGHFDHYTTTDSGQGLREEFLKLLRLLSQNHVQAQATVISPGTPSELSPTGYVSRPKSDPSHVNARLREIFGPSLPIRNIGCNIDPYREPLEGSVLVGYSRLPGTPRTTFIAGKNLSKE